MPEDWRVHVEMDGRDEARSLSEELEAKELEDAVATQLGDRVVVSNDGPELFLYAGTSAAARAAEQFVGSALGARGWQARVTVAHWHDAAEDWEPADAPEPATPEEEAAERVRLMRREDEQTSEQGYSSWEVRVESPSHHA